MGRQSSRLWFGRDHKDIFYNGNYHDAMYLTDKNASAELVWQKLKDDDYFAIRVVDYMADYETGELPTGGEMGFVAFEMYRMSGFSYTIDWGDGSVTENTFSHTYPTKNGTEYTVKIYGDAFRFIGSTVYVDKICSCITEILTPIKRGMTTQNYDLESGTPSYSAMFSYCPLLRQIPVELFDNVKDYEMVLCNGMFQFCGLENVPIGLFNGVKNWVISGFYLGCNNLVTIPYGAFAGGTFYRGYSDRVFEQCSNLIFVYDYPEGSLPTFEGTQVEVVDCYLKNVTNANSLFNGLTTLKTISNKLFQFCPDLESLDSCFRGCTSLRAIPVGLFDGLEKVTNYDYCFYGCDSIKEIPSDLFEDSYSANSFAQTFMRCYGLTEIPLNLFVSCAENSNFNGTFMGCENITSSVPELWNYTDNGNQCYNGCINASNYDDIPDDWK